MKLLGGYKRIMKKILVINGPNLNMLGIREPAIYGSMTYHELRVFLQNIAIEQGIAMEIFQSNHEGIIIDKIQAAYQQVDGIVINPAAYTHTSIGILDALKAVNIPCVEVHLSDIYQRESFRHHSYVADACIKSYYGEGILGYQKAIDTLLTYLNNREDSLDKTVETK